MPGTDLAPFGKPRIAYCQRFFPIGIIHTQPVIRAIGVSHTACKEVFPQNFRSHNWSVL